MSIKNTEEQSGKCKTVIQIDGSIIFTSGDYTREPPNSRRKEFEVDVGTLSSAKPKYAIRNISIKAYE